MNSKTGITKVGSNKAHRDSMQRNLLSDLIVYEYLTTTKAKSRLVVGEFDKLIKLASSKLAVREKQRKLIMKLHNENAVAKLLDIYQKRFTDEKSGFVHVYKLGIRKGDSSEMVKLMVKGYVYKDIGKKVSEKPVKKETKEVKQTEAQRINEVKTASGKSQLVGNAAAGKVKTRSGI
jgi:large subunit ribosomal protein L17